MEYTLNFKLKNKGITFFGAGPAQLMQHIQDGDSLNQAAAKLGMSYSKAWKIVRGAEKELGFALLNRQRGGTGGGGSQLTEKAVELLERYHRFASRIYQYGNGLFQECFGDILENKK